MESGPACRRRREHAGLRGRVRGIKRRKVVGRGKLANGREAETPGVRGIPGAVP